MNTRSDLPTSSTSSTSSTTLRRRAEAHLASPGPSSSSVAFAVGADALARLHTLASRAETAGDALKLLHELQVHQVELDMQREQLESSQDEVDEALARYVERFEAAPVALFVVDLKGAIREANLQGAALFASTCAALVGHSIGTCFAPVEESTIRELVQSAARAASRATRASGEAEETTIMHAGRRLLVRAQPTKAGHECLLAITTLPL